MTTHAMIDIETLNTEPNSTILTVGACKFNPFSDEPPTDRILWRPSADEQLQSGRTVSESTLEWWSKLPQHIQDEAFNGNNQIPLNQFFKELNKWLVGVDKIWCQGPQFDMVIIEHLFKQFEHHRNWAFWQIMDCRTIFNMMPVEPRKAIQEDLHDASADAYWQAVCVQQTYSHFGVETR